MTSFGGDTQSTQTWGVQQETGMWANSRPDNLGTNYTIVITQSPWGSGVISCWTPWCYLIKCSFRYVPEPQSHFWLIQVLPTLWSFSALAFVGLCAAWTNSSRTVLWGCYSLTEYLSLCLCDGHCCDQLRNPTLESKFPEFGRFIFSVWKNQIFFTE